MAHKGLRQLTSEELGALTYEQAGFDMFEKDSSLLGGKDYMILYPGVGTTSGYITYFNNAEASDEPYWIAIQNVTSADETVEIQARSVAATEGRGMHLSKDGNYNPDNNQFIVLNAGEVVYGKFDAVAVLKTAGLIYLDHIRLIRGA